MDAIYTAEAIATGDGRNGHGRSSDGLLDVTLAAPPELGGTGQGTNPEQLFAVGYAACFHSALRLVAGQAGADVNDSSVGASVGIGALEGGAFGINVKLEVTLPHLARDQATILVDRAHEVCPYSNATRGNIDVTITIADD